MGIGYRGQSKVWFPPSTWHIGHHDTGLPCPVKAREYSWVLMVDHSWQCVAAAHFRYSVS